MDTRHRVLEAAQVLFAAKGFNGTSLADISARCGISDGLILHHFQNKRNLYRQVQDKLAEQYALHLQETREKFTTPEEMMCETISASFNFWKQDSAYERISLWAYLEGQNDLVERETALTAGMAEGIRQLQDQGIINKEYSPLVMMTMVIGSIHFWMRYREQFRTTLGIEQSADQMDQQFLDQISAIFRDISQIKGD